MLVFPPETLSQNFLSGVANLNDMCRRIAGNVNSDVGIQTALHIAHETAHKWVITVVYFGSL